LVFAKKQIFVAESVLNNNIICIFAFLNKVSFLHYRSKYQNKNYDTISERWQENGIFIELL